MSSAGNDHYLSSKITDRMIAKQVSDALRNEHVDVSAAIKQIERITGIKAITARKWYKGTYAPKSRHLLTMAAYYPQVLQAVCELMGMDDMWQQTLRTDVVENMRANLDDKLENWKKSRRIGDRFVTIHVRVDLQEAVQLNQRQLWFLGQLQQGHKIHIQNMVDTWNIHIRTAKRDVAGLLKAKLIIPIKTGRTCRYELP